MVDIIRELGQKSKNVEEIFKILDKTTIGESKNPDNDIDLIMKSLEKTKSDLIELKGVLIKKYEDKELIAIKMNEARNSFVAVLKVLEYSQEMAIKYMKARYIDKNEFLERRFKEELKKSIHEYDLKLDVYSKKLDEAIYIAYMGE